MKLNLLFLSLATLQTVSTAWSDVAVFSGPQVGEQTTPFPTVQLSATGEFKEADPITDNNGAPTVIVFVHTLERSLAPLLRVIDQYGEERKDRLRTEIVFLSPDRLTGEQRVKAASRALGLKSRISVSPEGVEGPGNYGLNRECMMTVMTAEGNRVRANFALVQPGIADAPRILEALAAVSGDTSPPTVEQLTERHMARRGGERATPERMIQKTLPSSPE